MQKALRHPTRGLRNFVCNGFQVLFHSPSRGTFHFSLTLLFTIGCQVILSLGGWAPQIHARFHGTGATQEITRRIFIFRLLDYHHLWWTFPGPSTR